MRSDPTSEIRTNHVRERIRRLAVSRGQYEFSDGERRLIDDLLLLERWVVGEVKGTAMSIQCHQIAKRLSRDFDAIERELLTPDEIDRRRQSRDKGSRRRKGRAAAMRSLPWRGSL
jgi:hypothetical protein